MIKAIGYIRVSTDEQKENGFSLQDQEQRLIKHCKQNNIELLKIYQEDYSAKDFNRPEFKRILEDLKSKNLNPNLFLCVRMDRFSRNMAASLEMIRTLQKLNVNLKVLENDFNLDQPENLIPYVLNMLLPEVENKRRGLNTKRGMRQAMREGRWQGSAPLGYSYSDSLIIPNESSELIKEAFQEFSKGIYNAEDLRKNLSKRGLKISKNQFLNILRNPVYIGKIKIAAWNDEPEELVEGLHTGIVTEEIYWQVQDIFSGRKKKVV
jgi:site-specific DNA recombinase